MVNQVVKKFDDTVSIQYRRAWDGQRDGQSGRQTYCDSIIRAMHTRRTEKNH